MAYCRINKFALIFIIGLSTFISLSFYARQHAVIFGVLVFYLVVYYKGHLYRDRLNFRALFLSGLVLFSLVVVMSALLNLRNEVAIGKNQNLFSTLLNIQSPFNYIVHSGQITYFDFGVEALYFREHQPELFGYSINQLVLTPVPSVLLENKPVNFNRYLASHVPLKYPASPAFGFHSELYFNFYPYHLIVGPLITFLLATYLTTSTNNLGACYLNFMIFVISCSTLFLFVRSGIFAQLGSLLPRL